ncbi:MAG: alpha-2-macroglobulin family protein [Bacteroidota bacterium]
MRSAFLFAFLLPAIFSWTQGSNFSLIYELSNADYEEKVLGGYFDLTPEDCQVLVGSTDTLNWAHHPAGYYIEAKAVGEYLELALVNRTNIHAILLNNERDFALQIIDTLGQLVIPEAVYLNKKKVKYDEKTKSYRLNKRKGGGLLKVEAAGQLLLYEVDNDKLYNSFDRFSSTLIGRIVTTPIRMGRRIFNYFKRGFDYGDWRPYFRFPRVRFRKKLLKGYIATNQPIYRHNDTLKIKAYVAKENGRVWKDQLDVEISTYDPKSYQGQVLLTSTLMPDENGNIIQNIHLADSLSLDQQYSISIAAHDKIRNYKALSHSFKLEDYQLDEVRYEFSSEKKDYELGEKVVLKAEGKDQNGFFVADTKVQIIATTETVNSIIDSATYIPDTLWNVEQTLSARTATQIIFPDSLLPKADVKIQLQASFSNSNGELHEKEKTIQYGSNVAKYELKLEDGQLFAAHYRSVESVEDSVFLFTQFGRGYTKEKIKLPYQEKFNSYAKSHQLRNDEGSTVAVFSYPNTAAVDYAGSYSKDSVFIQISNPNQVSINYWIYREKELVETGQVASDFYWRRFDADHKTYHIVYQYVWKGVSKQEKKSIQHYKNRLNIVVEEPNQVMPSEEAQIKVKVLDSEEKAVKNVNLVAAAINAQFASSGNISKLEIPYERSKQLKKYADFNAKLPYGVTKKKELPIDKNWYQKLHLDQKLFYRLRFSEEAIYEERISFQRDSFYQNIAQFAPYVIEKGKAVPIFLIYCNRKLVYYYEAENDTPYSFGGKEGYNSIVLRTRKYEYQIDSVWLEKGKKLEFAINTTHLSTSRNITSRLRPEYLTTEEKNLLRNRMFLLRQKQSTAATYLWQDTLSIQYTDQIENKSYPYREPKPLMFGPFSKEVNIRFLQPSRIGTQFSFEPGFEYKIEAGRERLYASEYFDGLMILPSHLPYKMPMDSLIKPNRLRYKKQAQIDGTQLTSKFRNTISEGGSFQFTFRDSLHRLAAVALKNDSSSAIEQFVPSVKYFKKLPASTYTLLLVNQDFETYHYRFQVKKDSLFFININHPKWEAISKEAFIKWFPPTKSSSPKTPFISLEDKVLPFDLANGRTISGQVTDADGFPLIAASIHIKGTTQGTITDFDGYYTISVPDHIENPIIVVSYTGFNTQEFAAVTRGLVDFVLEEGVALDEVVVAGYGFSRNRRKSEAIVLSARSAGITIGRNGRFYNARYFDRAEDDEYSEQNRNTSYDTQNIKMRGASSISKDNPFSVSSLRSNFQDCAYWQPNLVTDQNGEAYFTVTYPDNITSWNTFVAGMDRKLRAGIAYGNTKSYKPLLAQLSTPRFLVEGDESDLVGKAVNYTNDTLVIATEFELEGAVLQKNATDLVDGFVEKVKVNTPFEKDSLHFQYQLNMGDYFDGEKRAIPIIRKGVERVEGIFQLLDRDTILRILPPLEEGEVKVFAEGDLLPSILRTLEYLEDYPYGCNEQTASRLWALLMKKKVYAKLGKDFEQEEKIKKMVARLEKTQNDDGSWGWWNGNAGNDRMSIYVTKALQAAAEDAYPTAALKKGLEYLALNSKNYDQRSKIDALLVLAKSNLPYDFENALAHYDSAKISIYERLASIRIRQILNQEYHLDSLYHHQKRDLFGATFWQQNYNYWYDRSNQVTLLAYEILSAAGKQNELTSIRQWFLQQRGRYIQSAWINTYQTATILATILPKILGESTPDELEKEVLKINGTSIHRFPHLITFSSNQAITIEKQGKSPVFFTVYQRYFETKPKRKDSLFEITSTLYQANKKVKQLEQGKRLQLKVEVTVKDAAEYVMIEIPIPAACSYYSKPNGSRFSEVHREYFKEKTAIFCQRLEAGKYEFELDLEARFSGNYSLNPVRVEQMYFPVFEGNNELKEVVVR